MQNQDTTDQSRSSVPGIRQRASGTWTITIGTGTRDADGHYGRLTTTIRGSLAEAILVREALLRKAQDRKRLGMSAGQVSTPGLIIETLKLDTHYKDSKRVGFQFRYGIQADDVQRMLVEQGGRCAICGEYRKLQVDHDHITKANRALLCRRCNIGLGMFKDDSALLRAASNYLVSHNTPTSPNVIDVKIRKRSHHFRNRTAPIL